ncbi:hypothetical protein EV129_117142 [Rhizobium azibense]|uniref:Uncharacterized protein n=1 Tax=Rhizobium azibense TaxID=1136135 RepID=A0A4V2VDL0_9HYPH|nr:hypothetical protein EV129_117142 [Rhizobium azibense]
MFRVSAGQADKTGSSIANGRHGARSRRRNRSKYSYSQPRTIPYFDFNICWVTKNTETYVPSGAQLMANNQRFLNFLDRHQGAAPIMPAVHTTSVTRLGEIINNDEIKLTECRFYKKDLSYFFYGKPAYKLGNHSGAASKQLGDAGVCFVFDLGTLPTIYKSFALDTGACFGKRYDEYLPMGVGIDDFGLPADQAYLAKVVAAFYGGNRSYFVGDGRHDVAPPGLDVASQAYADIARSVVSLQFDDRACTCEIQLDQPVALANARLLTVVMPDKAFDDPEVKIALGRWDVRPVLYRMKRARPGERTEVIHEKLGDFYELSGLI